MSDSEDSYGGYDLSEFTEEDFARIDAAISNIPTPPPITSPPNGGPKLAITLELSLPDSPVKNGSSSNDTVTPISIDKTVTVSENSPLRRYRRKGFLSVTDLVSPAWCELQFDYGLRQKRFLKPQHRPKSFVSGSGKEIVVQQAIAQENFQVQKKGHSVHKALEREVKPEAIPIRVRTEEERWALRLVNMMACFESLKLIGLAREIPIFGVVDGQVVVGIIDELMRVRVTEEGTSSKRGSDYGQETPRKRHKSPSDEERTSEVSAPALSILDLLVQQSSDPPTSPKGKAKALPRTPQTSLYMLHVLDTKSRRTNSLPPHADTLSSRLQVMLYHRLLNSILSAPTGGTFDINELWNKLNLDPTKPFSDEFLVQAGLIPDFEDEGAPQPTPNCLEKLVHRWYHTVASLEVIGVSPMLELVYRKQPQNRKGKERWRKTSEINISVSKEDVADQEEEKSIVAAILASISESNVGEDDQLTLAIQASLESYGREQDGITGDGPSIVDESTGGRSGSVVHAAEVVPAAATGSMPSAPRVESPSLAGASPSVAPALATPLPTAIQRENTLPAITEEPSDDLTDAADSKGFIIGTKKFLMDDNFLDEYLRGVLEWWRGHREARGVAESEVKRCNTCEYCNGCEWREAKATEIQATMQSRREVS
ncbi:EXO5 family protein [Pleurotus pulmonarius]